MAPEVIIRPNGRPYRPRRIICHSWDNEDYFENFGAVVLGTHDVEQARGLADPAIKGWFDNDLCATRPEVGWFRSGYVHGERVWLRDERRGAAGVMFTADYGPDTEISDAASR